MLATNAPSLGVIQFSDIVSRVKNELLDTLGGVYGTVRTRAKQAPIEHDCRRR